ncbi:hypothetical protein RYX36_009562 [Vicia faba]
MPISLRHNHLSPAVPVLPATHLSLQPQIQSALHTFHSTVIILQCYYEKGSQATAKQTAELLRSVISQQRLPQTNQATTLINAVRAVGEKLIAANPVELAVGNIARRVLHIIREEDFSLATAAIAGLELSAVSDDDDDVDRDDYPVLSAAVVAAAARSTLCPPSLQTLLEDTPVTAAIPHTPLPPFLHPPALLQIEQHLLPSNDFRPSSHPCKHIPLTPMKPSQTRTVSSAYAFYLSPLKHN